MTRYILKILPFIIIVALLGYFGVDFFNNYLTSPTDSPVGEYSLIIKNNESINQIGIKLEKDNVLNKKDSLVFFNELNPILNLQSGEFILKVPARPQDILNQIKNQNQVFINNIPRRAEVELIIKEGSSLETVAKLLNKESVISEEVFLNNSKNFNQKLKDKYSFLPPNLNCTYGDSKSCVKYYLEGYIFPDTYQFFKNSTIDEVFDKILLNFRNKVVNGLNLTNLNDEKLYRIVTEASMLEKETGRPIDGVNASNIKELNNERRLVASVFNNRIEIGLNLSSDPTVSYPSGKTLCQQTLLINDCIYLDSPESDSKYNTYQYPNLPVGPITSPQIENIKSVLEPAISDYLYFVSDAKGKKYFAVTEYEHQLNIQKAIIQNS
jgi:UPF0755 protein